MKTGFILICLCILPLAAQARLGERLKDFQKRYGDPLAEEAALSVFLHHGVFIYGYFDRDKVCHRIIYAVRNEDFVPVVVGSRKYKPMSPAYRDRFLDVNREASAWIPDSVTEPRLTWDREDARAVAAYYAEDYYLDISRKFPDLGEKNEKDILSEF